LAETEKLDVREYLAMPLRAAVGSWRPDDSIVEVSPQLWSQSQEIVASVEALLGQPIPEKLRSMLLNHEASAGAAVLGLHNILNQACEAILARCIDSATKQDWAAVVEESSLTYDLAVGSGRTSDRVLSLSLRARAQNAMGDLMGTVNSYRLAINEARASEINQWLGVCYDNLGNALGQLGLYDEALSCYDEATRFEIDVRGRAAIRSNQANLLADIGEHRSAAAVQMELIVELEKGGISSHQLAIALDNAAVSLAALGDHSSALSMVKRAASLFDVNDYRGRAKNALSRSNVFLSIGEFRSAGEAFSEAHDFALRVVRDELDFGHYRDGFLLAKGAAVSGDHPAITWFLRGLKANSLEHRKIALECFEETFALASLAGDQSLALRALANRTSVMADTGRVKEALEVGLRVRHEASALGLALEEAYVVGTLASLAQQGAQNIDQLGPLGGLARSFVLNGFAERLNSEIGPILYGGFSLPRQDGPLLSQLANLCHAHHADSLAADYYGQSADIARRDGSLARLVNRLYGLCSALKRTGDKAGANAALNEIESIVIKQDSLPLTGKANAWRVLGLETEESDAARATTYLRTAQEFIERIRASVPPGPNRAESVRQLQGTARRLAKLLLSAADISGSFEALQLEKQRRMLDVLTLRSGGDSGAPASVAELLDLLTGIGGAAGSAIVDIVADTDGITAYVLTEHRIQAIRVNGDVRPLAEVELGDVLERELRLLDLCASSPLLQDLVLQIRSVAGQRNLMIVPDKFAYNLPLHIVPIDGAPWCDSTQISYLPMATFLRFKPRKGRPLPSVIVGDSGGDLEYARQEAKEVAEILGQNPLIGSDCTRERVGAALRQPELNVIHFAIHGSGDARLGDRGSLRLTYPDGTPDWISFDDLARLPWSARLVVFSGCSTAVAGPRQGGELAGVAQAALESGAERVLACLWPVDDEVAKIFMVCFHRLLAQSLEKEPDGVDLREIMDHARKELRRLMVQGGMRKRRDGRDRNVRYPPGTDSSNQPSSAIDWAPFVLLGNPVMK
jgi:tetratricopeptide (TPR) repeat protein